MSNVNADLCFYVGNSFYIDIADIFTYVDIAAQLHMDIDYEHYFSTQALKTCDKTVRLVDRYT